MGEVFPGLKPGQRRKCSFNKQTTCHSKKKKKNSRMIFMEIAFGISWPHSRKRETPNEIWVTALLAKQQQYNYIYSPQLYKIDSFNAHR